MVSPEILRRYPFFGGLSDGQLIALAMLADEIEMTPGYILFREGDALNTLYLVLDGRVAITMSLPEVGSRAIIPLPSAKAREVTLSTVGSGDIFAWSSLVPPYKATSNARAATKCRAVALDAKAIRASFEQDPRFGYLMLVKVAQVARDRLQDLHYESLAHAVGEG